MGILQVIQMIVGGFSLFTIFQAIPKAQFLLRFVGKVVPVRISAILEIVGALLWITWKVMILKRFTVLRIIVYVVCSIVAIFIYIIDDYLYVYYVADCEEEEQFEI